jgi:amidohydrolase
MKSAGLALGALSLLACSVMLQPAGAQSSAFNANGKTLRQIYEQLHKNPELSFQEKNTSALLAAEMKRLGFTVTTGVGDKWTKARAQSEYGKVQDGVAGYGLVAVLNNGPGPTLMIRADMDALPLVEKTGLPYASTFRDIAWSGEESGVMHACGHDIHMTSLVGTARVLAALRARWSGTIVFIAQPAEEIVEGARAMLDDGLYTRFPRPDAALTVHNDAQLPAGIVGYGEGPFMSGVSSMDIVVRGVGGHGSAPHTTKDPVLLASQIVVALQPIISREVKPGTRAVVTVGTIHGGLKRNIIPEEVKLELTLRAYDDAVMQQLVEAIKRITAGTAQAAGVPEDRMPIVTVTRESSDPVINDGPLTRRLATAFTAWLGADRVRSIEPVGAAEDFTYFGRTAERVPISLWRVGATAPAIFEAAAKRGTPVPSNHNPGFAPVPEPTIVTGVTTMTAAVLELLGKK